MNTQERLSDSSQFNRTIAAVALSVVLAIVSAAGCGQSSDAEATPAEHFERVHADSTYVPHGKVKSGSVQEVEQGKLQYKTSDGQKWSVKYKKNDDGYRYFDSEKAN